MNGSGGSSDVGLLGWCILAVDGDQSVVALVKVGESESNASASGLLGWPIQCCQHVIHTLSSAVPVQFAQVRSCANSCGSYESDVCRPVFDTHG